MINAPPSLSLGAVKSVIQQCHHRWNRKSERNATVPPSRKLAHSSSIRANALETAWRQWQECQAWIRKAWCKSVIRIHITQLLLQLRCRRRYIVLLKLTLSSRSASLLIHPTTKPPSPFTSRHSPPFLHLRCRRGWAVITPLPSIW